MVVKTPNGKWVPVRHSKCGVWTRFRTHLLMKLKNGNTQNFDSKKDCEPTVDPENQNCESEMYTALKYFERASYAIICQLP